MPMAVLQSSLYLLVLLSVIFPAAKSQRNQLRFGKNGEFKILQVADMHYVDGKATPCEDVPPWAAVLGNHDQESTLSREGVMKHIVGLKNTLSRVNPSEVNPIDGFGNYNLEVGGVQGSAYLKRAYMRQPLPQKSAAPGLAYFHIPLPEFSRFDASNYTGVRQEGISSAAQVNSGFFTSMVESGD